MTWHPLLCLSAHTACTRSAGYLAQPLRDPEIRILLESLGSACSGSLCHRSEYLGSLGQNTLGIFKVRILGIFRVSMLVIRRSKYLEPLRPEYSESLGSEYSLSVGQNTWNL
jgi:hypothetical protein